jgi:hypothetical protein
MKNFTMCPCQVFLVRLKSRVGQHVALLESKRNAIRPFIGEPEAKDHWKNTGVGESVIFKWVLRGQDGKVWDWFI